MDATRLTDSLCYHGEGPHWSDSWGGLRYVDMLAGDYLHLQQDGSVTRTASGSSVVACVRPRRGGGAVLGIEKGFALEDADGTIHPLPDLWDEDVRMNEGAVAPDGSFLCGSMAYDKGEGRAAMWRLDPQREATRIATGLTISNGLAFTADGTLAYYVDTPTGRVDVLDWDPEHGLTQRRRFADLTEEEGHPDGLTLDSDGRVWVAMNGAGRVLGLDHLGEIAERVEVGARQVTACAFGGDELATLFITTSREDLAEDEDPAAGSLFSAEVGARGQVEDFEFAG